MACRPEDDPRGAADALSAAALHDATFALTSMGPRQVATPAEEEARAWIEAAFVDAGLQDVVSEPFTFDAWRPGAATVYAGGASGREVPVEALSPSPAADVELTLREADEDFRGAAVLLSSVDFPSRADALLAAIGGGAAAMIRVTEDVDVDGAPLVEVGHLLDGSTLPAVAVDRGTGDWLRGHVGEPVRIRVAPELYPAHTSSNVVGRVPGAGEEPGRVYVVAHYDSWHPSESAFDNALGAAGLAQIARHLADARPEREIVLLATSGEEQGLQGALAWAERHDAEIGPADVVVTLDVMWSAEGSFLAMATDPGLVTEAIDAAAAEGLEAIDAGEPGIGSDHLPFVVRGARAFWLGRWPDRHYHTVADTIDALDFDACAQALRTNVALVAAHAGLP